jgi:LAO/AO transport system kinase
VSAELADAVRRGDVPGLARALTVVENDPDAAAALLKALSGAVGKAHRVGVTGPPGAGKSTLISELAATWRAAGRKVGVVAVDPTSPFTGGALLGDRIRMGRHTGDAGVFIRSLASRGALGGLSRAAEDACDVLDAGGFDPVVVETVGVGQGEVAIASAADTVVVVVAPGSGDAVQAMKAGLLEAADVIVVNQSDRDGAEGLRAEILAAVELRAAGSANPAVLLASATAGRGIDDVRAAIDAHRSSAAGEALAVRRRVRALARVRAEVDRRRAGAFWEGKSAALERAAAEVVAGRMTAAEAAGRLLS